MPQRTYFFLQANIQWKVDSNKFQIRLATVGKTLTSNPHVQMHSQLVDYLNHTKSIADLVQVSHIG